MIREAAGPVTASTARIFAFMDQIATTYDWNDNAMMKLEQAAEGCSRSERHSRAGQAGHLAASLPGSLT